jgi:hypothetical protein
VLITWALAASVAAPLLGMSRGAAVTLGILPVVSGPTVVGSTSSGRRNGCSAVAAGCDILREDTGLIAAIFMGLALANQRGFDIPARRPIFRNTHAAHYRRSSLFPSRPP